jgi:uncharacterized phiE125 gp8 family phage protein
MSLVEVIAPDEEPITVADAKAFARVDRTDEDALFQGLIVSARRYAEGATRRALINQTWDLFLDRFPVAGCAIEIPKPPLRSITSIKYFDTAGVEQTWAASKYIVDTASTQGRVTPTETEVYPTTQRRINAVTVRFAAGYADAPEVPETVRLAIKMLTAHWYDNRGPVAFGTTVSAIPITIDDLLMSESVIRF